jgi:hypothetical protein
MIAKDQQHYITPVTFGYKGLTIVAEFKVPADDAEQARMITEQFLMDLERQGIAWGKTGCIGRRTRTNESLYLQPRG